MANRNLPAKSSQPENNPATQLTQEAIERIIAIQERQIELKAREIALEEKQKDNTHDYSKTLLSAQERDRKDERHHTRKMTLIRGVVGAVAFLLLLTFAFAAMYQGKDALAQKVIEWAVLLVAGGIGGYGLKSATSKSEQKEDG